MNPGLSEAEMATIRHLKVFAEHFEPDGKGIISEGLAIIDRFAPPAGAPEAARANASGGQTPPSKWCPERGWLDEEAAASPAPQSAGGVVICPDCRGERRGTDGLLCRRCSGGAQIPRSALQRDEAAPFEPRRELAPAPAAEDAALGDAAESVATLFVGAHSLPGGYFRDDLTPQQVRETKDLLAGIVEKAFARLRAPQTDHAGVAYEIERLRRVFFAGVDLDKDAICLACLSFFSSKPVIAALAKATASGNGTTPPSEFTGGDGR